MGRDYDRETHGNPFDFILREAARRRDQPESEKYPATGMQKLIPKSSDVTPAVSQHLGEAVVVLIRRTMKGCGVIDRERAKSARSSPTHSNCTGSALDAMLDMAGARPIPRNLPGGRPVRPMRDLDRAIPARLHRDDCVAENARQTGRCGRNPATKARKPSPYSEGGIIATVVGHNDDGATLVTQGFHRATGLLDTYCDEAYIGIPTDWLKRRDRHFYRAVCHRSGTAKGGGTATRQQISRITSTLTSSANAAGWWQCVDLWKGRSRNAMAVAGPAKHVHPDDYSPPLFVLSEAEVAQLSIALIPATGTQATFFAVCRMCEYAHRCLTRPVALMWWPNYGRTR